MRRSGWVLGGAYVAVVAGLAASAFWSPDQGFTWREGAAMLLVLPVLVGALPVVYVVGALAWNLTDADSGGPMWPVAVAYAVMFAGIAALNAWLLWALARRFRGTPTSRSDSVPT